MRLTRHRELVKKTKQTEDRYIPGANHSLSEGASHREHGTCSLITFVSSRCLRSHRATNPTRPHLHPTVTGSNISHQHNKKSSSYLHTYQGCRKKISTGPPGGTTSICVVDNEGFPATKDGCTITTTNNKIQDPTQMNMYSGGV